jgi:hypothetical protein
MAKSVQEQISVTDYVIALPFQTTNIADAAGTANSVEATTPAYVMPFAGSIVGIGAGLNGALSTGTVTFRPTISGTANTSLTTSVLSGTQRSSATKAADGVNFSAGQYIGVDWTKSGTVSPTTTDASIVLLVLISGIRL